MNLSFDPHLSSTDIDLMRTINFILKDANFDFYLGFGGIGDFLLLSAVCYDNPKAKVIFFANSGSLKFIEQLAGILGINISIFNNIADRKIAHYIYAAVKSHKNFKTSAHLPEGFNYYNWLDADVYLPRIVPYFPFIDMFGIAKPINDHKIIGICPCGSLKSKQPQRYLTKLEYNKIVRMYSDMGYTVYVFGSKSDMIYYKIPNNPLCFFITSECIFNYKKRETKIDFQSFFKYINSCDEIVSMDTWLKTYSLMAQIPTTVIKNRWMDKNIMSGMLLASDLVFLNPAIWPEIRCMSHKAFLSHLKFQESVLPNQ